MPDSSQDVFDIVVVGGGAAGLSAAIAAFDSGASTLLLESSATLGGTMSWSGGGIWVPLNKYMEEGGYPDSEKACLDYMHSCFGADEEIDERVLQSYVENARLVLEYLEKSTPLELEAGLMPDYESGKPGGVYGPEASRSVGPRVFDTRRLGENAALLRRSPYGTVPFSFSEWDEMDAMSHPENIDANIFAERLDKGIVGWGEAIAGALFLGLLERGVEIRVSSRATKLGYCEGARTIEYNGPGGSVSVKALKGIILCCGGYEWDADLMEANFPGVGITPATVPTNCGDGWRMAAAAGAVIGNEGACWGWPSYIVPGEMTDEGKPLVRTTLAERTLPHMIVVNSRGERFVDESAPYHSILKVMVTRDVEGNYPNIPAYHIFDERYHEKYSFGMIPPGAELPDWIVSADTVTELAARNGIDGERLEQTIFDFNKDIREHSEDRQFNRGESAYAHFWGDCENKHGPNLGPLEKAPYHSVPMIPSLIGTCSGPKIDSDGRVLGPDDKPLKGLYAAGNVTAAITGSAYLGPGATIGPAMVLGVLAARAAMRD